MTDTAPPSVDTSFDELVFTDVAAPADEIADVPAAQRFAPIRHLVRRVEDYRMPLRRRILLTFALGSFALSAFLAATTYSFTKSALLREQEAAAVATGYTEARTVRAALIVGAAPIDALAGVTQAAVLHVDGAWTPNEAFSRFDIPEDMRSAVVTDGVPSQMVRELRGEPVHIVGIPLDGLNAGYFGFTDLGSTDAALDSVGRSLIAAAVVTTGLGLLLGSLAARRSVRPLADAAQAAKAIAGGRLDTRLVPNDDPDLNLLSHSFNDMAAALQARVERDARFASDVSHELRSPLMTLSASAEVLQARRDDLPDKSRTALDLLVADVTRFQGLVEDLLEISRFDAGAIRLHLEDLLLAEFVRQAVAVSSSPDAAVDVTERGECLVIRADKRRLARAIANLIDNARFYGGGEVTVRVGEALGEAPPIAHAWIAVEDLGPGVPPEERSIVFERFARGASAGRRAASEGAGLGLSLVDEHVRAHSGRVWVEDRLDGQSGARFVIELPAEEVGV